MSRFSYGTESWTFNDNRSHLHVHNALMRLLWRLLRCGPDAHLQDDEILAATDMNSLTEILIMARLRYVGTLYKCREQVPWGLLNQDLAWTTLIADDFGWMWTQLAGASTLPDPAHHFAVWESILVHRASYWKRLVKRAGAHAVRQRNNQQRVLAFHRNFVALFHQVPGEAEFFPKHMNKEDSGPAQDEELHACMHCQEIFKSKGGLGAHLFKTHHIVAKVRLLFDQTSCGVCLKEFHTMSKLKSHLQRDRLCREELWGRRRYVRPGGGSGSLWDSQLCQTHDGVLPPLQGAGPWLPVGPLEAVPDYDLELAERIYVAILEDEGRPPPVEIARKTISDHPISWTSCTATLRYMIAELTQERTYRFQTMTSSRSCGVYARLRSGTFCAARTRGAGLRRDLRPWPALSNSVPIEFHLVGIDHGSGRARAPCGKSAM